MKERTIHGILLSLLITSVLAFAFNIQQVQADFKPRNDPSINTFTVPSDTKQDLSSSAVDVIHPQPGQFSNYSVRYPYPGYGWWNTTYDEYVQPHVVKTTQRIVIPPASMTYWCTVNTTNRLVTDSHPNLGWNQTYYILWIETDVTIGSEVRYGYTNASIVGSQTLYVAERYIDCWVANASYTGNDDVVHYDKTSGLMVSYKSFRAGAIQSDLILNTTNIPVGEKLSTATYFNLNPNPAGVGTTLTLRGILIGGFSAPMANETVKLYARSLAGSWQYITSVATNTYGIFTWQATIPRTVTPGTYIFAAYFPGSETHEMTYSLAALIIQ